MKITIEVKTEYLHNQVDNLTTSYSPWIHEYKRVGKNYVFKFDREKDDEGTGKGRKTITAAHLAKGLTTLATAVPFRFANIIEGDSDAIDADCMIQCAIFGKVIYG